MRYVNEYRANSSFSGLLKAISTITTRKHTIMEVCGGQTHAIAKYQLESLLPHDIELIHGPGCPVCVTPTPIIDAAIQLVQQPNFILATFGDMMRVPGTGKDLQAVKAEGADVRVVYSPLDAVEIARNNPLKQVVFFAIGFETTAPANAAAVIAAEANRLWNFSLLTSMVTVPAAVDALMSDPQNRVNGLLAAGHVCAVTGYNEYYSLAMKHSMPIVVTGFEPLDLLCGIYACVLQLERHEHSVQNCYSRVVSADGNIAAQKLISTVFEPANQEWRGLGSIPMSGLSIREGYKQYDAAARYNLNISMLELNEECLGGDIMRGKLKPFSCPAFGSKCTPEHPIGAQMVSTEGACSAYYKYKTTNL